MLCNVTVSFGPDRDHEFKFNCEEPAPDAAQGARHWFEERFNALECEPVNPMGKVLILDRILGVAQAMGEKSFADGGAGAQEFVRNTALALRRDTVKVDVAALVVG